MGDVLKHPCFYNDCATVTFLVEDCLFKVLRDPFERDSTVFGDMFLLPTGDVHTEEGNSDDNPIQLLGIRKDEFEQLLSVLLHRTYGKSKKPLPATNDEWVSVLKLAILWGFDTIREGAIAHLKDTMSPVDKVVLGQVYNLDFETWSLPAMHDIVRRDSPISLEEGRYMGVDMTVKLASVRERLSLGSHSGLYGHGHGHAVVPGRRPNVERLDFTDILRKTFRSSSD